MSSAIGSDHVVLVGKQEQWIATTCIISGASGSSLTGDVQGGIPCLELEFLFNNRWFLEALLSIQDTSV